MKYEHTHTHTARVQFWAAEKCRHENIQNS